MSRTKKQLHLGDLNSKDKTNKKRKKEVKVNMILKDKDIINIAENVNKIKRYIKKMKEHFNKMEKIESKLQYKDY